MSPGPPRAVASTGSPVAIASISTTPNVSNALGSTNRLASQYIWRTCSRERFPRNVTRSETPRSRACCSRPLRAGPSPPTSRRVSGPSRNAVANASSSTSMRFCSRRRASVAMRNGDAARGAGGSVKKAGSTGLGCTSMASRGASPRSTSWSRSAELTAARAEACSNPSRTISSCHEKTASRWKPEKCSVSTYGMPNRSRMRAAAAPAHCALCACTRPGRPRSPMYRAARSTAASMRRSRPCGRRHHTFQLKRRSVGGASSVQAAWKRLRPAADGESRRRLWCSG